MEFDDLSEVIVDWRRSLTVRNLSPRTITGYVGTANRYRGWLARSGRSTSASDVVRRDLQAFLAEMTDGGLSPVTVSIHYRNLQQLANYLHDEGLIDDDPFDKMSPPRIPEKPVPIFSDAELEALLGVCAGKSFYERRDVAILRVLLDCGVRVSELTGVQVADVDFTEDTVTVMGKGRKLRSIPFGNRTAQALRRYLRLRAKHRDSGRPELWLGHKGPVTIDGMRRLLERRGAQARVTNVHPHRFRHTFAHNWLLSGGTESDLMRLTGWRSRSMVDRYGSSAADQRAREAHRRKGLGDRF